MVATRNKTFTGCWTCRARSVKCDESRPCCTRCVNADLDCEGYGIRLVWPGDGRTGLGKRRLFTPALRNELQLSDEAIDQSLDKVDTAVFGQQVTSGLFGVFSRGEREPERAPCPAHHSFEETPIWPTESFSFTGGTPSVPTEPSTQLAIPVSSDSSSWQQPEAEQELFNIWTTRLSVFMTPIPHPGNIFTDIILPMALKALDEQRHDAAYLALLHGVLAMTAFWKDNISGDGGGETGRKYLDSSLSHLSQCLKHPTNIHVILAAISTLLVVPAFIGEDSAWRVHMRGGAAWIQTVDRSIWDQNDASVSLLQLFSFYVALNPVAVWSPSHHGSPGITVQLELGTESQWRMDNVVGITRAITECIRQINFYLYEKSPTPQGLNELELQIYLSSPDDLPFPDLNEECTILAQYHARLYYLATHVYFACCLKQKPAAKVQNFIRSSLRPIRQIRAFEEQHDVSGILWPYFVLACEALDVESRLEMMRCLDHREAQGVGSSAAARRVIIAVWKEQDASGPERRCSWNDVMAREKIDLLLL